MNDPCKVGNLTGAKLVDADRGASDCASNRGTLVLQFFSSHTGAFFFFVCAWRASLRILVFLVIYDSGQVSLEHLLYSWYPCQSPPLSFLRYYFLVQNNKWSRSGILTCDLDPLRQVMSRGFILLHHLRVNLSHPRI